MQSVELMRLPHKDIDTLPCYRLVVRLQDMLLTITLQSLRT